MESADMPPEVAPQPSSQWSAARTLGLLLLVLLSSAVGGLPILIGTLSQLQHERRQEEERREQEIKRQFIEIHEQAKQRNSKKHVGPAIRALMGDKQP